MRLNYLVSLTLINFIRLNRYRRDFEDPLAAWHKLDNTNLGYNKYQRRAR